jgi:hypothetical protein
MKFETVITRIGCNLCDSPKIIWSDMEDSNHLCKVCYDKER